MNVRWVRSHTLGARGGSAEPSCQTQHDKKRYNERSEERSTTIALVHQFFPLFDLFFATSPKLQTQPRRRQQRRMDVIRKFCTNRINKIARYSTALTR